MLQRLGVEEADGGTGGKGHPDAAARLDHVRDAGPRVRVGLEGLLPEGELQKNAKENKNLKGLSLKLLLLPGAAKLHREGTRVASMSHLSSPAPAWAEDTKTNPKVFLSFTFGW